MGNTTGAHVQDPTAPEKEGTSQEASHDVGKFSIVCSVKKMKRPCCKPLNISYGVLTAITIFECIAVIAVAVTTAIAIKAYSSHQSGRVVAMILLAVTAGVSLSILIYALLAVFRKQTKPIHATAVVLIILVIIQAVICAVSVIPSTDDEKNLSRSLTESFKLVKDQKPRHLKLWGVTQHNLYCCGVNGPEDYRPPILPVFFPPEVPISCCPNYDPDRSELVQERERENCKARREYFDVGCNTPVIEVFRHTGNLVFWVVVVTILSEIVLAALGLVMFHKETERKKARKEAEDTKGQP